MKIKKLKWLNTGDSMYLTERSHPFSYRLKKEDSRWMLDFWDIYACDYEEIGRYSSLKAAKVEAQRAYEANIKEHLTYV